VGFFEMEEQVLNCFLALLGADQVKRVEAEKFIESIESHPSYSLVLISILSSINLAISYRQITFYSILFYFILFY